MNKQLATNIFLRTWEGRHARDESFQLACQILGLDASSISTLRLEARRQERGRDRLCILTPSGMGSRRR